MILASLSSLPIQRRARPRGRTTALVVSTGLLAVLLLGLLLARPVGASPTVPGTAAAGAPVAGANQIQAAPPGQAVTSTVGSGAAAPAAVGTSAPGAVQTGGPQTVLTGGPPPIPSDNPAGVGATGATGATAPPAADSGAWIPWLVGAIILAGLAGLAVFAVRQRTAPAPATARTTVATARATAPAPLPTLPEPGPAPVVTQVRCPNCDALNPADRRYCDECGQDLRPATTAAMAPPIPDVDEATTPYLETLSRVDEQLEFVLARNVIKIGRALDNDIVIDDQFMGWQTVSPHHARLTRQPEGFMVEDLDSENGTFVNSARTGQNLLEDGMTLALGKVEFIYRVPHE